MCNNGCREGVGTRAAPADVIGMVRRYQDELVIRRNCQMLAGTWTAGCAVRM